LSAAAVVISLAVAATAEAGPKGGSKGGSSHSTPSMHSPNSYHMNSSYHTSNYVTKYGTQFKGGYCYKGKDHCHWTYKCWWGDYGCYCYYCPYTYCWYYWYPQDCCYYPCSYVKCATPVYETAPVGVPTGVTQVVNVANNSPGSAGAGGSAAAGGAAPLPPPGK
jgi:hypothetical protein